MKQLIDKWRRGKQLTDDELQQVHRIISGKDATELNHWLSEAWNKDHSQVNVHLTFKELKDEIDRQGKAQKKALGHGRLFRIGLKVAAAFMFAISVYTYFDSNKETVKSYQVVTQKGERKTFWLPDSTRVQLNVDSKIVVAQGYSISNRNISLTGEAIFKVSKNEELPFVVDSDSLFTRAVGTKFQVSAYPVEGVQDIVLFEGAIVVSKSGVFTQNLSPGERLKYHWNNNLVLKERIASGELAALEHQGLVFNNANFSQVIRQLERYFNVTVHCNEYMFKDVAFSMHMKKETSIEDMLMIMGETIGFTYRIDQNKQIYIKEKETR
ncbi:DUF4974 domain-containing protein [Prolixibacteraceae bacterium JC049]|nr:DUF4974 domain-containing protein [Prolixibacteraceae bacterium JC049]